MTEFTFELDTVKILRFGKRQEILALWKRTYKGRPCGVGACSHYLDGRVKVDMSCNGGDAVAYPNLPDNWREYLPDYNKPLGEAELFGGHAPC